MMARTVLRTPADELPLPPRSPLQGILMSPRAGCAVTLAMAALVGLVRGHACHIPDRDDVTLRPPDARAAFFLYLASLQRPKVLELGTKRSIPDRGTSHKEEILRFNPTAVHVGADVEPGLDVDVVVDAHRLTENFPRATFDAFIAASVFEHLRWPWLAALELNR